jgi:hypothetical protein
MDGRSVSVERIARIQSWDSHIRALDERTDREDRVRGSEAADQNA